MYFTGGVHVCQPRMFFFLFLHCNKLMPSFNYENTNICQTELFLASFGFANPLLKRTLAMHVYSFDCSTILLTAPGS